MSSTQRAGSSASRAGLTEEEVEEIREAFKLFDTDGSGTISPVELKEAMLSLGLGARNSTVTAMISQFDTGAEGRIDFEQFLDLMTAKSVSGGSCVGR
jgi:Ca2+-binding EF-hand superfamily protein